MYTGMTRICQGFWAMRDQDFVDRGSFSLGVFNGF